jgi:hypothetical protein
MQCVYQEPMEDELLTAGGHVLDNKGTCAAKEPGRARAFSCYGLNTWAEQEGQNADVSSIARMWEGSWRTRGYRGVWRTGSTLKAQGLVWFNVRHNILIKVTIRDHTDLSSYLKVVEMHT